MRPVLDRERIAAAALELVTDDGVGRLTMAQLARRLGVAASALYNHIGSKAELTALLQDAVMGRVDVGALAELRQGRGRLDSALAAWGRSYREVFASYPTLIPLIATMPISGAPATRRMYDTVSAALGHAGVPTPQVVPVIIAFESFLFGSAMDVHAPASIFTSQPGEADAPDFQGAVDSFTSAVAASGRDARASREHDGRASEDGTARIAGQDDTGAVIERNPYADAPFELGLDALIRATLRLIPSPVLASSAPIPLSRTYRTYRAPDPVTSQQACTELLASLR